MNKKTQSCALLSLLLFTLGAPVMAANVSALGNHYGVMLANYAMVESLQGHCKDLRPVTIPTKSAVDSLLRTKAGDQAYQQMLTEMQGEDFDAYAHKQSEEVWSILQACDNPQMEAVLKHIETTHTQAYSALNKAEGVGQQ